jgi:cobalt-zinc-cadmium efflux system outer membrane protein
LAAVARLQGAQDFLAGAGTQPNPLLRLGDTIGQPIEELNSISQRLEIAGQPALRKKSAIAERNSLRQELLETDRQLLRNTAVSYFGLWQAKQRLALANLRVDLSQRLERIAQRRLSVGEIPANEHLRASLELTQSQASLATAQSEEANAQARLRAALGRSDTVGIQIPDPTPQQLPEAPGLRLLEISTIDQLQAHLTELPVLKKSEEELSRAQSLTELARRARSPELSLSAYRGRLYDPNSTQGIALTVAFPLWDWGSIGAEVDKRRREQEALAHDVDARRLQISLELQEAWQNYLGAKTNNGLLREQARQFYSLITASQKGYSTGYLSLLEVLDAERAYRNLVLDYIASEASLKITRIDLELAAGGHLLPEELP